MFGAAAARGTSSNRTLTFSVVMVFFPNLMTTQITLSRATFMEWLSSFGGQLSLFIGASVITMLELAVFTVRVVVLVGRKLVGALRSGPRREKKGEMKEGKVVGAGEWPRGVKKGRSIAQVVPITT